MNTTTKLSLVSIFALSIAAPVQAQNPKQGDYYEPSQTAPQQASPGQQQQIKEGDYYKLGQATPNRVPGNSNKKRKATTINQAERNRKSRCRETSWT